MKVALAVAEALSHIHNEHKVLHGDLKSANVLIRGDFEEIKLCDFGVSVKMNDDMTDVKVRKEYLQNPPLSSRSQIESNMFLVLQDILQHRKHTPLPLDCYLEHQA